MEEIEFRGLSINKKKWIYGCYVHTFERGYFSRGYDDVPDRCHYIDTETNYHEIYSNSVGQYTGLKDKNNKKVYRGDILSYKAIRYTNCSKTEIEKVYETALIGIIFHSDMATVVKAYSENVSAFCHDVENNEKLILELDSNEIEVVGNIYENQELLGDDYGQ